MSDFAGKVAVVTGAGSGIGRAIAVELARRGATPALVDIDGGGLAETAQIVRALGRQPTTHTVDVADRAAMDALAADVVTAHAGVDILVNNAGVCVIVPFEQADLEDYAWLMGVNFWGVVHGCQAFLPHLRRASRAWIVNVSSAFGLVGIPNQSAYCASKFAVRGFTEALDSELMGSPITVCCVHPGGVATRIVRNARFRSMLGGLGPDVPNRLIDRGMPPERAARIVVDGMEAGRRRILVGGDATLLDALARLWPVGYRRAIRAFLKPRRSR